MPSFPPHRRKQCGARHVLVTIVACLSVLLLLAVGPADADPAQPRSRHSGATVGDTLYFIGGLDADNKPVTQLQALDLTSMAVSSTKVDFQVYGHVAMTQNKTDQDKVDIGIMFGAVTDKNGADALRWLDIAKGTSSKATNDSKALPPLTGRINHSVAQIKDKFFIIGGESVPGGKFMSDILIYDSRNKEWTVATPTPPIERVGHSSVAMDDDHIFVCFGKIPDRPVAPPPPTSTKTGTSTPTPTAAPSLPTEAGSTEPDCVIYEVSTNTLIPATLRHSDPSISFEGGRMGHTMVHSTITRPQYMFMFGGTNLAQNTTYSDLITFGFSPGNISNIIVDRPFQKQLDPKIKPSGRAFHSATIVGDKGSLMVVYGGADPTKTLSDNNTYFYHLGSDLSADLYGESWLSSVDFMSAYEQSRTIPHYTSVWIIIASIVGSVSLLGVAVFVYIRRGLAKTEEEKRRKEYENRLSTMSGGRLSPSNEGADNKDNKHHNVYHEDHEDHSMHSGPFKSTTSLIQPPPEAFKKGGDQYGQRHRTDSDASGSTSISHHQRHHARHNSSGGGSSKPWILGEPPSPGENTLMGESGYDTNYRLTPPRMPVQASVTAPATSGPGSSNATTVNGGAPYYNPRDLYPDDRQGSNHPSDNDDDDDTSVGNSESTMPPWTGTLQVANSSDDFEFAPPNPRFSRGAISAAHRQLVSGANRHRNSVASNNNGWDNRSPGGATVSSRDDNESQRRSVNSMQWVSFEPDSTGPRPESEIFDPLRSIGGLTVRNASWVQPTDTPRGSLYGNYYSTTGPSSDGGGTTTSEDSFAPGTFGGYYSPSSSQSGSGGERRISAAALARQQRRSMRNSQDSFGSNAGGGGPSSTNGGAEGPMVTKVLPVLSTRTAKPTVMQLNTASSSNARSDGSTADGLRASRRDDGGAGGHGENRLSFGLPTIDEPSLSTSIGMTTSGSINLDAALQSMPLPGGGNGHPTSSTITSAPTATSAHGPRISSMLNPKRTSRTPSSYQPPQQLPQAHSSHHRPGTTTNVILKMPPPPKHHPPRDTSYG